MISPSAVLELRGGSRGDGAEVELRAPAEHQRVCRPGRVLVSMAARAAAGDGVAERVEGEPGRWWVGGSVGAVEADDGVEVDEPAPLVLGDLGVGQPGVVREVPTRDTNRVIALHAGRDFQDHARLSFAKVAEYQRRGVVHFHAVIRLDGPDGPTDRPRPGHPRRLSDAVSTPPAPSPLTTPRPDGSPLVLAWGAQLDLRPITLDFLIRNSRTADGDFTDAALAGYIAKYATKSTGAIDSGEGPDRPIWDGERIDYRETSPAPPTRRQAGGGENRGGFESESEHPWTAAMASNGVTATGFTSTTSHHASAATPRRRVGALIVMLLLGILRQLVSWFEHRRDRCRTASAPRRPEGTCWYGSACHTIVGARLSDELSSGR